MIASNPNNWRRSNGAILLILIVAAVAIRAVQFGNPVIQIDEQFYLLVGDRMLHGAVPFVDFWDRKPYGLFLIYAAIRSMGGDGILAYQLVATLSAVLTAFIVVLLARRVAPQPGGLIAALVYLVYLSVNGGDGGQAPVFYNLLVALAVWLVVLVIERPDWDRPASLFAAGAMLTMGLALQVKYSVVFEGAYLGIVLLITAWRRELGIARITAAAALWVALALVPTIAVIAGYWQAGHLDALLFTNFESIFLRHTFSVVELAQRLLIIVLKLLPIALAAAAGARAMIGQSAAGRFLVGWSGAAIAGFLLFGTYHDHYALPLVLPLAVGGAWLYADLKRGIRLGGGGRVVPWSALVLAVGAIFVGFNTAGLRKTRGDGTTQRALAATIRSRPDPSLFIFRGDPVLYYLTNARIPTAYNFPTLLVEAGDGKTLGIDQIGELRRTMATLPHFVLLYTPVGDGDNPAAWAVMRQALAARYRLIQQEQVGGRTDMLYELRGR